MLYFFVAFLACTVGAISGLGGGIIIKPILDIFSPYDVATINLLSSFTVLSMAIASTGKHLMSGTKFQLKTGVFLALGGALGGNLGNYLFNKSISSINNETVIKIIQSSGLTLLLLFVLLYMNRWNRYKTFQIESNGFVAAIGILLGTISSYFGIGGGPINIVILSLFFSMDTKKAAVNSIILILFSQSAKVLQVFLLGDLKNFDLRLLLLMIPAGIIGGILGSKIGKRLTEKKILFTFNCVLSLVIVINLFNIVRLL